jgi:hypothetical protein
MGYLNLSFEGKDLIMPKNYSEDYIKDAVELAITSYLKKEWKLGLLDANERSMTHKFAEHLKRKFPGWDVDCEYNRDRNSPDHIKRVRLELTKYPNDDKGQSVFPDIIVHVRGKDKNLLVIEAKKDSNIHKPEDETWDKTKLDAYKQELSYVCGAFIVFKTGDKCMERPRVDWC